MTHDWRASKARFRAAMSGEQPDRVPLYMLVLEQMIARVQGITIRELFSSPKFYANSIINAHEFFHTDNLGLPTAYAGPAEVAAFAEANGKKKTIHWRDYQSFFVEQGEICKTAEDIDNLNIPDHRNLKLWNITFETSNLIYEKINMRGVLGFGIWSLVQELRGVQAYRDIKKNPELLLKLCEKIYESQIDALEAWEDKVGSMRSVFVTGYSFNSHMMSFENAMKFEGDFIKRFQKRIGNNAPIFFHNCGTSPYWKELCKELNINAVNGSHPLDIDYWIEFRKQFPRVTIVGANIDVSREMLTGNPVDVELKVKENIDALATISPNYIVAPQCALPWGVPLSNVIAVSSAVQKYGSYPLS